MYQYSYPHPIVIELGYNALNKNKGYLFRKKAFDYVKKNKSKGAQAANDDRQGYGILAEIIIRAELGLPPITDSHPVEYDLLSKGKAKIDVKCRGGEKNFEENYPGEDQFTREAKHNLFARQLYDRTLKTDIFLLTHLRRPAGRSQLPGGERDRSWKLFICGWISKKRALHEAVYIPPGGITEQGSRWFPYQYHNVEIYNKCLNGLSRLQDLLEISIEDVRKDENRPLSLHMTGVDAYRIVSDLVGRGVLERKVLDFIKKEFKLNETVKSILHSNQYFHLLEWLKIRGCVGEKEIKKLKKILTKEVFEWT